MRDRGGGVAEHLMPLDVYHPALTGLGSSLCLKICLARDSCKVNPRIRAKDKLSQCQDSIA